MEVLWETLAEFILEALIEIGTNKKISKWIRYPILFVILIIYIILVLGITYLTIKIWTKNRWISLLLFVLTITLTISLILKCKNLYKNKEGKKITK